MKGEFGIHVSRPAIERVLILDDASGVAMTSALALSATAMTVNPPSDRGFRISTALGDLGVSSTSTDDAGSYFLKTLQLMS